MQPLNHFLLGESHSIGQEGHCKEDPLDRYPHATYFLIRIELWILAVCIFRGLVEKMNPPGGIENLHRLQKMTEKWRFLLNFDPLKVSHMDFPAQMTHAVLKSVQNAC